MATITTSILTGNRVDMSNPFLVDFGRTLSPSSANFSWFTGNIGSPFADVDIHGSGFTYSGSGDARELASGTITSISIDVGNDNSSETQGDLVITGTEGLVASNIDKDDPRSFWNEVLKGNDTFNLVGLAEADVGFGTNIIFGDDLASATSSFAGVTDSGGNDTIFAADNELQLIGDVFTVSGDSGSPFVSFAEYDAGDDTIVSAVTDRSVLMVGDAMTVGALAVLHGGDDNLDNSHTTNVGSSVVGDVLRQVGGTVNGGNDTIETAGNSQAGGSASGDVTIFVGGTLNGGGDVIFVNGSPTGRICGDVDDISETATSGTIDGGNDRIIGGTGTDLISGDVLASSSSSVTVNGGDDTLSGGGSDDALYGELAVGSLGGVSGGNDLIFGGSGFDRLFGQTGSDRLNGGADADTLDGGAAGDRLDGGSGNDRLTGGGGPDTFAFTPGTEDDRVLDFADTGGPADDLIDVSAYNFGRRGEIGKAASGDDLILTLGGDTVRIVDYLVDHTANQINDDILI